MLKVKLCTVTELFSALSLVDRHLNTVVTFATMWLASQPLEKSQRRRGQKVYSKPKSSDQDKGKRCVESEDRVQLTPSACELLSRKTHGRVNSPVECL